MTGKGPYPYPCPECGQEVLAVAAYAARQQRPCRACIRTATGWTCHNCGSADPWHPSPCPMPDWREDKVAQMLGVAEYGCPRCGHGAIDERDSRQDRDDHAG